MDTIKEYSNADYEADRFFDRTTSLPDGIQEKYQFKPNLPRPTRRINSADDIQRYKDHFIIAQKNQGKWFKWKHYLQFLRDDLCKLDTFVLMSKSLLPPMASPADSEKSHYVTASEAEITEKVPRYRIEKSKSSLVWMDNAGDTESLFSVAAISINSCTSAADTNSVFSLTPQKNLLKKFCTEIRQLASKTYKTVEKMAIKSKYCSSCGEYIGNVKVHKECSQLENLIEKKGSLITGKPENENITRTISMTSITSIGSGESAFSDKQLFHKKKSFRRRMLPFIKESS